MKASAKLGGSLGKGAKGVVGHGPQPFKTSSGHRKIHHGHTTRNDGTGNGNLAIYRGSKRKGSKSKAPKGVGY